MIGPVPAPTEGAVIRAAGRPLALSDGTVVLVRFGFGQLMEVEARFGSIMRYADALDGHVLGPIFTAVAETVSIMLGKPVPAIVERLEIGHVAEYAKTILDAFTEAMPRPRPEAVAGPKAEDGPGPTSTTSPPSGSDAATPPSSG